MSNTSDNPPKENIGMTLSWNGWINNLRSYRDEVVSEINEYRHRHWVGIDEEMEEIFEKMRAFICHASVVECIYGTFDIPKEAADYRPWDVPWDEDDEEEE